MLSEENANNCAVRQAACRTPSDMRAGERVEEIATILAEGILRLKQKIARKDRWSRDVSLDSSGHQSVHAAHLKQREAHDK